jgi:tRNA pseudouridine32 synthase/23S rRNA pseudouridine746 synthase
MYKLIFQNNDFLLIDKLQAYSFHNEANESGLFNLLKNQLNNEKLYPVHRLDKITTGLLLTAKNKIAAQELSTKFSRHEINKYYLAISDKKPKQDAGCLRGDLKKLRRGQWTLTKEQTNPAVTLFKSRKAGNYYVFCLKPLTGKTHQIRASLKFLGSPICGDNLYYPQKQFDRAYLQAYVLEFNYQNENYYFESIPKFGNLFNDKAIIQTIEIFRQPQLLEWDKLIQPLND